MKTPPQIVYELHGSPPVHGCEEHEGRCYVCAGSMTRGKRVAKWMGSGFTDHSRVALPTESHVCEGCCYITSRVSPVLGRPPGKCKVCDGTLRVVRRPSAGKGSRSKIGDECPKCDGTGMQGAGGNFRNVSNLWEHGWRSPPFAPVVDGDGAVLQYNGPPGLGYVNASKGEKPLQREFLAREHEGPWFAAIADSGQKHVLPYARINGPGRAGVVLFDDQLIRVPGDVSLIGDMCELLTVGATKEELASGVYGVGAWTRCESAIRGFEGAHAASRGGGWFALALWLAQRDESEVQRRLAAEKAERDAKTERRKNRASRDRVVSRRAKQGVHSDAAAQGAQALAAPASGARGEPDGSRDDGPVAGADPHPAAHHNDPKQPQQLALFGVGEARRKPRGRRV